MLYSLGMAWVPRYGLYNPRPYPLGKGKISSMPSMQGKTEDENGNQELNV